MVRAEGSVVRQEMWNMIRAEQRAFGRVEFDVDTVGFRVTSAARDLSAPRSAHGGAVSMLGFRKKVKY